VVSSAWSKAVEGLLDNVDMYPGMSSDWAEEGSSLGEAQVSTAVQKDKKRLSLLALVKALLCMFRTWQYCAHRSALLCVYDTEVFPALSREGPTDNALIMKA